MVVSDKRQISMGHIHICDQQACLTEEVVFYKSGLARGGEGGLLYNH